MSESSSERALEEGTSGKNQQEFDVFKELGEVQCNGLHVCGGRGDLMRAGH